MDITIAICTQNRAKLLTRTLQALETQITDKENIEVLVIDNHSEDNTRIVVSQFSRVDYLYESQIGIAYARNRAVLEAKGEWLIYLDDDAVPSKEWLKSMTLCIQQQFPRPECIVGKVDLEWENDNHPIFLEHYETVLSRYDLGLEGHYLEDGGYILTANTAFNRKSLVDLGCFRTDLGRRGNSLLSGEDTDIFNRLIKEQRLVWYEPQALVYHWVPLERQRFMWLVKRLFWEGATQPLLDYGDQQTRNRYFFEMSKDIRRTIRIIIQRLPEALSTLGKYELCLEISRQIGRLYMNFTLFLK